jgi:carboxyl-terminal processing protease
MRFLERVSKAAALLGAFAVAFYLALNLRGGSGLWEGLAPAIAANNAAITAGSTVPAPYDLTQLRVVNEVLKTIRDRYVDPKRVKPKEMLLSALNYVQRDVAQVSVEHDEGQPTVKVRVDTQQKEFRVDNVQGPWDVSARLRDVFAFLQDGLRGTEVDLREIEYQACNGMLHTLDPHSVLLTPEQYKEMNLSTSGQFGGLGIVISIRDQQLTVINPMPGTPAGRAGIKKYDRVTKINNEATLNMGLNEAVSRLRGAPGSKVTIYVHREGPEGWAGSRPFELVRETIHVASVEHRLLDGNIGYVRLKQFQANTATDLDAALADLKKGGELKGLVLDLRANPGGLLDQAARVADKFISEGAIVATVGNPSEGREEKVAHGEGTEPNYPLAVLVNGSSASASEIVTGALKNHDRAVIIGDTTFGKGSVQLVFTDLPDKAALKLTIAQYLTEPGDVSIQGVGVTPDIELDPMTVDPLEMDLDVDTGALKERDLSRSLSNARAREGGKPLESVRYDLTEKDRRELRERGGDPDEVFAMDFQVKFARDFVAHIGPGKRVDQVHQARAFIGETRVNELAKAAAELKTIGVDWSDAPADLAASVPPTAVPNVDVKVETDRPNNEVVAGDAMALKVTVTNRSTQTLYRLSATTKTDDPMFDQKELVFGKIDPGKSKTATAPLGYCEIEGHRIGSTAPISPNAPRICHVPKEALTRADGVKVKFEEARGHVPADAEIRATVKAVERPSFAYSYDIVDNRDLDGGKSNGDGRLQKGEGFTFYLTVKNVGKGRSYETQANLKSLSGDGLFLHEGRFDISNMNPGDTKRVAFTFDVEKQLADTEAKVELTIADEDLREVVAEKIRLAVAPPVALTPSTVVLRAKSAGVALRGSPDPAAAVFGKLASGTVVQQLATAGEWAKVSLGGTRFAFVRAADLESGGGAAPATVAFDDTLGREPPQLDLAPAVLATRDSHTVIKGSASDAERLLDGYVFVGARKVFYRSNRNGPDTKKMAFEVDVPLRPGVNVVQVVARENPDTVGHKTFIIRRDGPNGELLQTPKTDEELSENASAGDDE